MVGARLLHDVRMAPVRDTARLDELPADEREAWTRLWARIRGD